MRDQLFGGDDSEWQVPTQEINESLSMSRVLIVEVDAVFLLLNLENLIESAMLKNQLFDEEEGLFVFDVLSDLDDCAPGVRSELFLAVLTLCVGLNKLNNEGLLDH